MDLAAGGYEYEASGLAEQSVAVLQGKEVPCKMAFPELHHHDVLDASRVEKLPGQTVMLA